MIEARQYALSRASELGIFGANKIATVIEDPFAVAPGGPGSIWQSRQGLQGTSHVLPGERGGVARLDSGIIAGGANAWEIGINPVTDRPGLVSDPGEDGSFWYLLWLFRIPTTPDNQASCSISFRPALEPVGLEAQGVWFGVDGVFVSSDVFMAEEEFVNFTVSGVAIAPGSWHRLEAYQRGIGKQILFRFDGEPEKVLTMTRSFGQPVTLNLDAANGSTTTGSQQTDSDHMVLVMDGNVPV
jgi:hypothetical protein